MDVLRLRKVSLAYVGAIVITYLLRVVLRDPICLFAHSVALNLIRLLVSYAIHPSIATYIHGMSMTCYVAIDDLT